MLIIYIKTQDIQLSSGSDKPKMLFFLRINVEMPPIVGILTYMSRKNQGGESRGFNDRVHGISSRYSDTTCKKINYISTNTYSIIMQ